VGDEWGQGTGSRWFFNGFLSKMLGGGVKQDIMAVFFIIL